MSFLKKLFGIKEEPTVVESSVELKVEPTQEEEEKPEVISGDEPLVGK